MTRELAIIIGFIFLVVCVTASNYAGLSFKLTRLANDKFKNPTATECDQEEENLKFCTYANSRCDGNCCQCTCDNPKSTFDRSTMKCRKNDEIRNGCKAKFDGKYAGTQIKFLDLSKKGETKVYWPTDIWSDKVKSFDVINITSYHDGSGIKTTFLKKKGKPKKRGDGNWEATIKWDNVLKEYHGKLFRVSISYEIERNLKDGKHVMNKNDCFVFKSSGSITVTFPSPPSTTLPPSTTEKSTSTSTTPSSSTMRPRRTPSTTTKRPSRPNTPSTPTPKKPTDPVEPSVSTNEISTPTLSMTTQITESKKTRKPTESTDKTDEPSAPTLAARKEGSAGGNTAVTVSLAVVSCLVLLVVVVVLVVLWTRRRSAKASEDKRGGAVDAKENVDNPMENIYAEADNSINYPEKGKKNYVYDYAEGNLESNYTSLDMSKVESKPTYESLVNVQSNMYEHIPVQGNTSGASGLSGQTPIAEPFYHVVDTPEGARHPGQSNCETREIPGTTGHEDPEKVYSTLEEESAPENYGREVPGRTGDDNPERVYSTLEEESAPENYGREVPGRTGDDDPERVYSVLEDETAESDYLTVLPEKSDYEQPVNPPVPVA